MSQEDTIISITKDFKTLIIKSQKDLNQKIRHWNNMLKLSVQVKKNIKIFTIKIHNWKKKIEKYENVFKQQKQQYKQQLFQQQKQILKYKENKAKQNKKQQKQQILSDVSKLNEIDLTKLKKQKKERKRKRSHDDVEDDKEIEES